MSKLKTYKVDYGFWSYAINVRAESIAQARAKALTKLRKADPKKFINKQTTYVSQDD